MVWASGRITPFVNFQVSRTGQPLEKGDNWETADHTCFMTGGFRQRGGRSGPLCEALVGCPSAWVKGARGGSGSPGISPLASCSPPSPQIISHTDSATLANFLPRPHQTDRAYPGSMLISASRIMARNGHCWWRKCIFPQHMCRQQEFKNHFSV